MDQNSDSLTELSRLMAALVVSGRLARHDADGLVRRFQSGLRRSERLLVALMAVLDEVLLGVERGTLESRVVDGVHYFALEHVLSAANDRKRVLEALRFAATSLRSSGVVALGVRARFDGAARRRYLVIDLEQARRFLAQRRPVLAG